MTYPVIRISFESITSKLSPLDYSSICYYSVSFDKFQNIKLRSSDIETNYFNFLHHFIFNTTSEWPFSVYTYWWVFISNILISYGLEPPIAILDVSGIRVEQITFLNPWFVDYNNLNVTKSHSFMVPSYEALNNFFSFSKKTNGCHTNP